VLVEAARTLRYGRGEELSGVVCDVEIAEGLNETGLCSTTGCLEYSGSCRSVVTVDQIGDLQLCHGWKPPE
jgi:hypothetical protein